MFSYSPPAIHRPPCPSLPRAASRDEVCDLCGLTGFRYGRDPLCITACLLYLLNSLWLRGIVGGPFLSGHFNDLLLIPAALPWLLWFMKRMGLREGGRFPSGMEVFVCGTVWAVVIEGLLPLFLPRATADWMDVAAYAVGGLFAWFWWKYAAPTACFICRSAPGLWRNRNKRQD